MAKRTNPRRPYQQHKGYRAAKIKRQCSALRSKLAAFFLRPSMLAVALLLALASITTLHHGIGLALPALSQLEAELNLYDAGKTAVVSTAALGETQVHFIDVGQGDATLISQGGSYALIDAGLADTTEDLLAYLDSLGIETIDILVMTHPHADHIGAMDEVIATYDIGTVILPDFTLCEEYPSSASFLRVIEALETSNATIETAVVGASYALGDGTLEILGVGVPTDNLNDISVCTLFTAGDFTLLCTGDAESPVEEALLESGQDLSATVFQAGHHGSSTSNTLAFLQAVQPELVVISCGLDNSYGHPHTAVLNAYDAVGAEYYRTDLNGNVVVCYTAETGITVMCEQPDEQVA